MKKFTLSKFLCAGLLLFSFSATVHSQEAKSKSDFHPPLHRCSTMEAMAEAIRKDPSLPEKWRIEGEKQYQAYLQRQAQGGSMARTQAGEIIVPIVFHIVDAAAAQAWITDRDIYEQVEILNRDYAGKKLDYYSKVIPPEIAARVGRIPIRFVLARRTPTGALTSGIERRVGASPLHVQIKSFATGGLDAWDVTKYMNVWAGTFSGADNGLLGIATFPFTTGEGAQGVVVGTATLPYFSNTARSYYPQYAEGSTLTHEIGHYFYLFHTFGDLTTCNNQDFRLQAGWPLPTGAGPEGDDTPAEKAGPGNAYFGNPSQNYSDGCATETFGMMYGSYMNYFDDRALFMFSDGMRKRVVGCIDLYRPGLKTSDGATPPSPINDAYLVNISPRGTPERVSYVVDNSPFTATVRNSGTTPLTSVTLNVKIDAAAPTTITFPLNLAAGNDTTINLATLTAAAGNHTFNVYVTNPNAGTDAFLNNDTIQSFVNVSTTVQNVTAAAPFTEDFSSATFPPATFRIFNPNGGASTWTRSATSGFTALGSATFQNYNIGQVGTLDDLISVPLNLGVSDSSLLSFRVAHAVYDAVDVSQWDGLEVYVSGDGGINYNLVYKKTGNQLKTIAPAQAGSFTATPAQPDRWRTETVNLSPYIVAGKRMIIKFRNTNAFGNNTYLDDISVTAAVKPTIDIAAVSISNLPDYGCTNSIAPSVVAKNNGLSTINNYKVTYILDNAAAVVTTINTAIPAGQSATVPLGPITTAPGNHTLLVVVNSPNGLNDAFPSNDTLRKSFVIFPTVLNSLTENFESATFPPNGWAVANPDASTTWAKTTLASRKVAPSDSSSAFVRNFTYAGSNKNDDLLSPIVKYTAVDSVFLQFDVAASTFNYPGATALNEDTLEVLITKDCGATFQSVYKKWGTQLQTLRAPNDPNAGEYFAGNSLQAWRRDSVNLLPFLGTTNQFQVVFRNKHNSPGNNVFIDNVNVSTRVLPNLLKQQGYLILPTAFTSQFSIWSYDTPTNLKGVGVYNSVGQQVFSKQFNGNADRYMTVDMSNKAAGVYFVTLYYTDATRNITQKVVKY